MQVLYYSSYLKNSLDLVVLSYRYEVMLLCWNIDAAERPKFNSLVNTISGLLEKDSGYLELSDSNGSDYVHLSQMFSLKRSPPSESTTASSLPEVEEQKISKQETEV